MKAAAVVALVAAGCLPRGPAPLGTHLVATRAAVTVQFLPARADGARPLLIWQGRADGDGSDLAVTEWSAGALAPLRPLAPRVSPSLGRCGMFAPRCGVTVDERGRAILFLGTEPDPNSPAPALVGRVDLVSGAVEPVGNFTGFEASPSGRRVIGLTTRTDRIVVSDGGASTTLEQVQQYLLVGEDLFYLTGLPPPPTRDGRPPPGQLAVLRADGSTIAIDGPVASFDGKLVGGAPKLVLQRPLPDVEETAVALLDPATLAELPLPMGHDTTEYAFSDDGRRLALASWIGDSNGATRTFTFVELATGATETVSIDAPSAPLDSTLFWRPRHDEAWILGRDRVFVWRPGMPLRELAEPNLYALSATDGGGQRAFTADGAYYFAITPDPANHFTPFFPVYLVSADDPTAPRLRLNGPGTGLNELRNLPDGRLLIRTWITLPERGDIHVVDPARGTIRAVAIGGILGPSNADRTLAQLHWLERAGEGDLTLVDLGTAAHTLLGENVLEYNLASFAPDGLAPGAPIWMRVRSALPSPYDGLWVAALP